MAKIEVTEESIEKAVDWFFEHAEEYGIKITPSEDGKSHFYLDGEEVESIPCFDMFMSALDDCTL